MKDTTNQTSEEEEDQWFNSRVNRTESTAQSHLDPNLLLMLDHSMWENDSFYFFVVFLSVLKLFSFCMGAALKLYVFEKYHSP